MNAEPICYLLLAHQPPGEIARLLDRWQNYCQPPAQLLLCYGGPRESFGQIAWDAKIYIDDPRLRTRHHQREKQSYTQIFQRAAEWLRGRPELAYVYFAEFDHWPVAPDLGRRLVERLRAEKADVLGHQLARRDRTCCVHYLNHVSDDRFLPWIGSLSQREDRGAVFNMFGSGSFWTREAFLAVAAVGEPFPIYLEIYLPTVAHHLGFRVRDLPDQAPFISATGERYDQIASLRAQGAWTVHPVKKWPAEGRLAD